jgi:hypothetical protein
MLRRHKHQTRSERTAQIKVWAVESRSPPQSECADKPHLLPLLRAIITSTPFSGRGRRRRAHAVAAGVRRRADQSEDEAQHASNDPLQHRPSPGDVARMCSRSRLLAADVPHAPTFRGHGAGDLGERRAEAELRWGARRESEAAAAAVRVRAHFIDRR